MVNIYESFYFFLKQAGYKIESYNGLLLDDKIEFCDKIFYDFDSINDVSAAELDDLEIKNYNKQLNYVDKLKIKKYYFKKIFKKDMPEDHLKCIWNNNKIQLVDNIINVIDNNNIIKKLQKNYKWNLLIPDELDNKFKLKKTDLKLIFDNVIFKDLKENSSHHLIIKNYINTIYRSEVIKPTKVSSGHYKYVINDKIKDIIIIVNKYRKINSKSEILFVDDDE